MWSFDHLLRRVRDHEIVGVETFLFRAAQRAPDDLNLYFDISREANNSVNELLLQNYIEKVLHGIF